MKKFPSLASALVLLAFAAPNANATAINWSTALPLSVNAGIETPLVLFGFNPQPEPPPAGLVTTAVFDPAAATLQLSGISPNPFLLYTAAQGGRFVVPPEPIADFDRLSILFETTGGANLNFLFTLDPGGDGDASSGISDPLFFNPQPEPPPLFDAFAFQFAFNDLGGVDEVALKLQVFDETGRALALSPVPVPAAAWLFGTALLGLLGFSRRRRSRQS